MFSRVIRRSFALMMALGLAGSPRASEGSTIRYSTDGTVGSGGISGGAAVRFEGVGDGLATTSDPFPRGQIPRDIPDGAGSPLGLGRFVVEAAPGGGTTTFDRTPFAIQFRPDPADGVLPIENPGDRSVTGWLSGTVGGTGPSTLSVSYRLSGSFGVPWEPRDEVACFAMAGGLEETLTIPAMTTPVTIGPDGVGSVAVSALLIGDGPTTLGDPRPAPEPGAWASIAVGAVGLLARARWRRRRAR